MLKTIISICLILASCNQENDKYKKFINQEINVLLKDSAFSSYKEYVYLDEPSSKLSGVIFVYDDKEVVVYVGELKHVERFNRYNEWDFDKVIKEKLVRIKIYGDKNKLIYDSNKAKGS